MEKKGNFKKIVLAVIILILILLVYLLVPRENKYEKLENSMLATAKSLISNNLIEVKNNYYFTLNQMEIKDSYDCSRDSGVYITKTVSGFIYNVYLICNSYESKMVENTKGKYITLIGANPLIIQNSKDYIELGYQSQGYRVETVSSIQNAGGVYKVSYYVYDNANTRLETVNRYVVVSEVNSKEAPVITLYGDSNMTLKKGEKYIDPGYIAKDDTDGIITNRVIVTNNVNSNVIGDYEVIYKVTNSKGLTSTKKRIVSIISETSKAKATVSLEPSTATNQNVNIIINITSDDYYYTILPDESRSYGTTRVEYTVSGNDTYDFTIYEKNGSFITKKVLVDNIDRTIPTGSCSATTSGGKVTYKVNASDESGIKGYSYNTDYGFTEYRESNTFEYFMDSNNASVIIKDKAGNTNRIYCNVAKVSNITDVTVPSTISLTVGDTYEIPITLTPSSASKSDVSLSITSGENNVSLSNYTLKALNAGNATIKLSVKDSTITKTISVTVKAKSSGLVSPTNEENETAKKYSDDSAPAVGIADWCGKHAGYMQAYYNGNRITYDAVITISVGQTIRIKLNLIQSCGTIKLLTRTSAGGQSNWSEWVNASSSPFVDRYNSNTFINTNSYEWIITGKKKTNGQAVLLSQTSTIKTNVFNEIKSFYRIKLVIK